jgi:hypothetical protein
MTLCLTLSKTGSITPAEQLHILGQKQGANVVKLTVIESIFTNLTSYSDTKFFSLIISLILWFCVITCANTCTSFYVVLLHFEIKLFC